jgi:hypothetical protein
MPRNLLKILVLLAILATAAFASPQLPPPDCGGNACPDPSCQGCHYCCPSNLAAMFHGMPSRTPRHNHQHDNPQPIPAKDGAGMLFYASALPIVLAFGLAGVRKALHRR